MYSEKIGKPLELYLKPSESLQRFMISCHAVALLSCLANSLPFWLKLILTGLLITNGYLTQRKLEREQRIIKYSIQRGWELGDGTNFILVSIAESTVLSRYAIFLHTREQAPWLIAYDALKTEEFRQLTVKLKITIT